MAAIIGCLFVIVSLGFSYVITALVTWLICFGFGFEWSWVLSLGVWGIVILLRWIISAAKPKEK